jgi:hypothetical protein
MPTRRFPPVDELEACFVVKDGTGQKLAYVYYEEQPGPAICGQAAHQRRGRRIAVNIAKLPELLSRHQTWGVR